ncbi:MAG: hypothetical protein LBR88_10635 [Zoogloeaceae bacterium]|jgi:hypothetical protein|nr:hypothetical protein [Zoogloeaceae bacterium]
MKYLLETPPYSAPVSRWQEWLAKLRALPPEPEVLEEIARAEKVIPRRIALDRELEEQAKAQATK